jgi:hypothetical protein
MGEEFIQNTFTDHQIFSALLHHCFQVQMVPDEIISISKSTKDWTYESFENLPVCNIRSLALLDGVFDFKEEGTIAKSKMKRLTGFQSFDFPMIEHLLRLKIDISNLSL